MSSPYKRRRKTTLIRGKEEEEEEEIRRDRDTVITHQSGLGITCLRRPVSSTTFFACPLPL
jgi:hypothetical protein